MATFLRHCLGKWAEMKCEKIDSVIIELVNGI